MKAIGFKQSLNIEHSDSFIAFETEKPAPKGRDLLVKIEAISVNPVDYKIRQNSAKDKVLDSPKIIGWDAVGIVEDVGSQASLFKKGDLVFYAGDITRPGTNAEYQLVDERIVGHKPKNSSFAQSAAMPLTSLTAWEILFDRIRISDQDRGKSVLIIGGGGGVGSIAVQLAKKVAGLTVIATASREETKKWCLENGADFVVNHYDLVNQVRKCGFEQVDFILDLVGLNHYWDPAVELIKPQGHIASISDPKKPIDLNELKTKSVSFSWEFMYTRPMFNTEDMIEQHNILDKIAELLDKGLIKSTVNTIIESFSVDNLKKAHAQLETGKTIGKTVIVF